MSLDALPIEVRESALLDSQKKVLNVFYVYNTLDKTNENGSFYITNEKLRKESEISSNKTIQNVLSFLITNKIIERKAGKQCPKGGVASTYVFHTDNLIDWCKENPKKTTKKISTPKISTPKKCTDVKCTDVVAAYKQAVREEAKAIWQEINELKELVKKMIDNQYTEKMGTPNDKCTDVKCTTDIDIDSDIEKDLINRSDNTCSLNDSNEIETRSISDGENESNNGDISDLNDVYDGSDCESTPKENEELTEGNMQKFTDEERRELNEFYGRDWKELQEVRESESMKHKGEYVEFSEKINKFNECFKNYYHSKDINTFTEREKQLWSLKSQIEEDATHLKVTDKQADYVLSLEPTLKKTMAGKKKFKEKVVKSQMEKAAQAQPMANVNSNRENVSSQQEKPCKVQRADGDLSDELNKLFEDVQITEEKNTGTTNANNGDLSRSNVKGEQLTTEEKKTAQGANNVSDMAFVESECNRVNKQYNLNVVNTIINTVNTYIASADEKEQWINKYFDGVINDPSYMKVMRKKALEKVK